MERDIRQPRLMSLCVSKKWQRHFFEKGVRAEFGP